MSLTSEIEEFARSRGADLFGVTSAKPFPKYLEMAAELEGIPGFKERPIGKRINSAIADPKNLLPSAESIIMFGVFGKLKNPADDSLGYQGPHAVLASYWRQDRPLITRLIEPMLIEPLTEYLRRKGFEAYAVRYGGPLPLKAAAVRAGLGDYGKNTIVYTKERGSWVSLAAVVTNAKLESTEMEMREICGKCNKCIEACPTGALREPYKLDVLRCRCYLSHSSMQDVGEIPDSLKEKMENLICGCEVCQNVCPRNERIKPRELSTSFSVPWHGVPMPDKARLPLPDLLRLLQGEVSPYFQRYVAICIGNMEGAEEALPALTKMLTSQDPLVRKYALWAINRIKSRAKGL